METNNFTLQDKKYMELALRLAEKGRGKTRPNPMVGAVIVKNNELISTGYHRKAGLPHAEVEAVSAARQPLAGSTMYVTLEPCNIYGKTPPCTDLLIREGFFEVVIASPDPNPRVNNKGIEKLRAAGIKVKVGLLERQAARQNEEFFKNMKTGLPWVTLKAAASLDGRIAAASGDSKWITSEKSRLQVQKLRREAGCVLTGIGTVAADDPYLFPRSSLDKPIPAGGLDHFKRVILDPELKLKLDSNLVKTASAVNTIVITAVGATPKTRQLGQRGIEIAVMKTRQGKFDIPGVLALLYKQYGITSLLVEAGTGIATSFLRQGQIDKYLIFLAPLFLGGGHKFSLFGDLGIETVAQGPQLKFSSIRKIDRDILITAYPIKDVYRNN
ncbi:MAG: bifunctional diaminohydroxyphosphoribosylaminopyrimidine deaminase/5-amino-6-(5-phosphoribosylamino)uracil reductase RibD [Actinomycetota bacterium]|nr:bifunctional diaminohydroxyphosphoribosylaminopyrimidine deaminase/5-amino-6-(5-phosphoribosylamino)uracil reductase RibD [Actinomycetota bacterium]